MPWTFLRVYNNRNTVVWGENTHQWMPKEDQMVFCLYLLNKQTFVITWTFQSDHGQDIWREAQQIVLMPKFLTAQIDLVWQWSTICAGFNSWTQRKQIPIAMICSFVSFDAQRFRSLLRTILEFKKND
jgi:hypothetical protein